MLTTEYIEMLMLKGVFLNTQYTTALFKKAPPRWFTDVTIREIVELQQTHLEKYNTPMQIDSFSPEHIEIINKAIGQNQEVRSTQGQKYLIDLTNEYMKQEFLKELLVKKTNCVDVQNDHYDWNKFQRFNEIEDTLSSFNISAAAVDDLFITSDEWNAIDFPKIDYYLYPVIPEASMILLVGERGAGKSMYSMAVANAIAKGTNFGPWIGKSFPTKVLYIDGEIYYKEYQDRTKQMDTSSDFYHFCRTYEEAKGIKEYNFLLTDEKFRQIVKDQIIAQGIKFVVFDNLASLTSGIDENAKKDYDPINQYFLELRSAGVSVMIVHHTGKTGTQRGTSGREDNVDSIIQILKPTKWQADDGLVFDLTFLKFRGYVDEDNKHMIKKRQLSYDKNGADWEWCFNQVANTSPKDIILAACLGTSQDQIHDEYQIPKNKIRQQVDEAAHKGYIVVSGTTRNRKYTITDSGLTWLGNKGIDLRLGAPE